LQLAVICVAYLGSAAGVELLGRYFGGAGAGAGADIWLHVDAATDIAEYQALAERTANLHLAAPRLRCWWGGFNGARAVLATAAAALEKKRYDRFIYLTEDSVPLMRLRDLQDRLVEDIEYIDCTCTEPPAGSSYPSDLQDFLKEVQARYDGYYCYDCDAMNFRHVDSNTWIVTQAMELQMARLAKLRARGKVRLPALWTGNAYWALSADALEEILSQHQKNEHLRESFEFSAIPEEQYYHTILGNSRRRREHAPFMLMDFTREPRPFIFRAADELAALQEHPHLFARKVDIHSESVVRFVEQLARHRVRSRAARASIAPG
jgi:hypothetical protein